MNIITYEEIKNMLTEFQTLKANNSENNTRAQNGFSSFSSSGVNIRNTAYAGEISSKLAKMSENSAIVQQDYDRIIKYLTKLADTASNSATNSVNTAKAREVWNATETVNG